MVASTSISESFYTALDSFLSIIPRIIGAALLLVVGWLIAGVIARLVQKVLDKAGADRLTQRAGIDAFFSRAGVANVSAGKLLGTLVKWWIRLIVVEAAVAALGITAVSATFDTIVAYVPNIIVAVVIVGVAAFLAKLAAEAVRGFAQGAGYSNASLLGTVTQLTILVLGLIAALQQAHIAETLVNQLTIAALATIVGSCVLAFGLGGRPVAEKMLTAAYDKGQSAAQKAQAGAQAQPSVSGPPSTPSIAPRPAASTYTNPR